VRLTGRTGGGSARAAPNSKRCFMTISPEELRKLFIYDPKTGILRNRIRRGSHGTAGKVVGTIAGAAATRNDYLRAGVGGQYYQVTHIIWAYMTGKWPQHQIDHKNRKRLDNRWENLREATISENKCNSRTYKNNTLGVKGISRSGRNRYKARIKVNGKGYHIGCFDTISEAKAAWRAAARRFHGEFARTE